MNQSVNVYFFFKKYNLGSGLLATQTATASRGGARQTQEKNTSTNYYDTTFYMVIQRFCLRNIVLIFAPWKFHVLKATVYKPTLEAIDLFFTI